MPLYFAPGGRHTPPPHVKETVVEAFAHCEDPYCAGYGQKPVHGVRTVVEHTIGSRGGDGIFAQIVENTNEYLRFEDPADVPCASCGKDRAISLQARPVYPNVSGFPQTGLLNAPAFDSNVRNTAADEKAATEMAEMRARMVEMAEQLAALKGPPDDAVG
jgi:hypothetical protein